MLPPCAFTSSNRSRSASFVRARKLALSIVVGLHHVDVQVAVADVPEEADLPAGVAAREDVAELGAERLERGDRERDVVLVREPGRRERLADRLRGAPRGRAPRPRVCASVPSRTMAALEERRDPRLERVASTGAPRARGGRSGSAARPSGARSLRCARTRARHASVNNSYAESVNGARARLAEEAHDAGEIARRRRGARRADAGMRASFSVASVTIAERPFAADEELAQVEPGVVLLERAVELEHLAAREDDLRARAPTGA